MKKLASFFFAVVLITVSLSINAAAAGVADTIQPAENETVIYFENGYYAIITISEIETEGPSTRATQTKSGVKTYNFYNTGGELMWQEFTYGTFTYTGTSATCTASSVSYTVYSNNWKVTSAVASRSGNTAIGDFIAKRYTLLVPVQTETTSVVLTCSATGTLY